MEEEYLPEEQKVDYITEVLHSGPMVVSHWLLMVMITLILAVYIILKIQKRQPVEPFQILVAAPFCLGCLMLGMLACYNFPAVFLNSCHLGYGPGNVDLSSFIAVPLAGWFGTAFLLALMAVQVFVSQRGGQVKAPPGA